MYLTSEGLNSKFIDKFETELAEQHDELEQRGKICKDQEISNKAQVTIASNPLFRDTIFG